MNAIRWCSLWAVVVWLGASPAAAQEGSKTPAKPPPTTTGQAVPPAGRPTLQARGIIYLWELAPDFFLDGSHGKSVKLSSLRGNKTLLLFVPYKERLRPYNDVVDTLMTHDVRLVGICSDKQHNLRSMAQRESIRFLMLGDVTGDVSAMYGLFDPVNGEIRPGAFLLDSQGYVRLILLGQAPAPENLVGLVASVMPLP
jgi:peroxiredoxin